MASGYKYERLIPGDTVTVVFSSTDPNLEGTFREYLNDGGTVAITIPPGEEDPNLYTVVHISAFAALVKGPIDSPIGEDLIGETVEVRFAQAAGAMITGTVIKVDPKTGWLELSDGGETIIVPPYSSWYITII